MILVSIMTSCPERAVNKHENGILQSSSAVNIEPQYQDQTIVENRENDKTVT